MAPCFRRPSGALLVSFALVMLSLVVVPAVPAAGQTDPAPTTSPPTTSPPTTAPPTSMTPTTAPPTTAPPSTTRPKPVEPAPTQPGPAEGPDPDLEDGEAVDEGPESDDPLHGEGLAEPADSDDGVVSSGRYSGQPEFVEPTVDQALVRAAEGRLLEAEERHRAAIAQVKSLRLRVKELELAIDDLDEESQDAVDELLAAELRLQARALSAFVKGDALSISPSLDHDAILQNMAQKTMVESVFDQDEDAILVIESLRSSLDTETGQLYERLSLIVTLEATAHEAVDVEKAAIAQATLELRTFRAGSPIYVEGLVFPIDGPVELPLIDSFGFARMTGTPDEHWHEGIDIFAPEGTPLVATERSVVTRVGTGRLGGLKVWIHGESGIDWYYAHLSRFAPGIAAGDALEAGDLIGFVGTSGNAVGTPPHVHLQMHPGGGRPTDPYPLLDLQLTLDEEAAEAEAARQAEEQAREAEADQEDEPENPQASARADQRAP